MKNNPGRKAAMIMVMVLMLTPILWLQGEIIAYAATPTFIDTKVEIIGEDEVYQLEIKDKVAGSTYKWSSNNTKIARVSSKGLVTSVGKGTATIRCIITYPSKKTKTINAKVTVIIPATKVKINNATEVNGAHVMQLGESFNFNRDIVPTNSSDKTYWSIGGGDEACIEVTNSSSGIVKALKPGKAILVATAARTATAKDAANSIVNDAIIIEVVAPSAAVDSIDIIDNNVMRIVFDSPINESTVIGPNNTLLDNIEILPIRNIKGVYASDPGKLTAQFSADKKTLTITSVNNFKGEYGVNITSNIITTGGITIEDRYKKISYEDTIPPRYIGTVPDESGLIVDIMFSEAIDFSGMKVQGGGFLPGSSNTPADPLTVSILNNKNNYIVSEDKKSLRLNLANIALPDFKKPLSVTLTGIKDLSGIPSDEYLIVVTFIADNTPKPMAVLKTVERTGYLTLTATFDRSIESGGYASIGYGLTMWGIVDTKDPKKVHYTMNEADALKTGVQNVTISNWRSFNADPKDTSSYQPHVKAVNFDVDRSSPIMLSSEYDPVTSILTLTYNKAVTLVANTGFFNASLVTVSDEIRPNNSISYTMVASSVPEVVKLQLSNMTLYGRYTFTLSQNFVMDSYRNYSIARTITVDNASGVNLELPPPYSIMQSTINPSEIYIEFNDMLDVASATNKGNYSIPGVVITDVRLLKNTKDVGATVVLTVAPGSISMTLDWMIRINGVTNYSGTYAPLSNFERLVRLKENVKPYYINPVFNSSKTNEISLVFSEDITGSIRVKVTQMGSYSYEIGNVAITSGNSVIITLNSTPIQNSYLQVDILENKIVDLSGNEVVPMIHNIIVPVIY